MSKDDDGFTMIESKFKYMSLSDKKNKRKKKRGHVFQDPDQYTLADLEGVLSKRREALTESRFYKELVDIFHASLIPTRPHDMVCYGIGSIQHSKNAQFQFVLALFIRDLLKIPGQVSIFDPVMTDLDKELCKVHDIHVIETNEDGKRSVQKPTLFYMPHCGRGLYSNTLSANWNKDKLGNVIIIGNRFDMYVGSQLERELKRECPLLIPAVDIVDCVAFPKEFDDNKVFNDLSIQTFPQQELDKTSKEFWDNVSIDGVSQDKDVL
ncbi:SRR1-domain-containing protein [Lichtheimia hyalospora FSU 10163]|nr:SRR1-domain-containing protein [Lichtheimia hyalospora FSU 10163]